MTVCVNQIPVTYRVVTMKIDNRLKAGLADGRDDRSQARSADAPG
jgi:hypothetical protein